MTGSLLLTAALALGADPVPAPTAPVTPPVAAPVPAPITVTGTGCNGCGAPPVTWGGSYSVPSVMGCCDSPRAGLFDRLRSRFTRPKSGGLCAPACDPCATAAPVYAAPAPVVHAPAPACCGQPVFTGFTTSCNDPCERQGLLARLRAKFRGGKSCDAYPAPLAGGCCGSSVAGFPAAGCTSSFGTVLTAPPTGGAPVLGPGTAPPDKMPAPVPNPMPTDPKKDEPKKELSADVPSVEAPRVPTLGGTSGKY